MLRNYLLIALRNFRKQKLFSAINMFGLALGLASALLIFLYVSDELRYDTMQPHYNTTWRIGCSFKNPDGQEFNNTVSPGHFIRYLKDNRSEVLHATRIAYIGYPTSLHYKAKDKIILTEEIKWAEPGFDKAVHIELLKGNLQKLFDNQHTMAVSESGAKRLFGNEDPMGKTISVKHTWATNDREIDVVVTGVYKDPPANSHFKPKFILNVHALRTIYGNDFNRFMESERFGPLTNFFENYVVLRPGADIRPIQTVLDSLANKMILTDSASTAAGWKFTTFAIKLPDLHFDQKNLWENTDARGDKVYLGIFSAIAVLIMLIACINYMNLATARSARRAKEVGLRKSLGSNRGEIASQFFLESFLTTTGALLLALVLAMIFLQPFNLLTQKSFTVASLFDPYMLLIALGVVAFMGFVSGIYPSLYLSAFQPAEVLKGQVVKGRGAELLRKGLVTLQYTIALVLIICTFIVINQMDQLKTTKLNQRGNQLLSIRFGGIADQSKYETFKRLVLEDPQVAHVTMANHLPRLNYFGWIGASVRFPELQEKAAQWNQLNADYDFGRTYNVEFVAGRDFQPGNVSDSNSLIVNEAIARALNKTPQQLIGASVSVQTDTLLHYKVIGVAKDFPFRSMHQPIEPLVLSPRVHQIDRIVYVQLPKGNMQEKIASIEKKWKAVFPSAGFDHWFVSDEFNRMYVSEQRISSLAKAFAVLAIVITILGVFGLASYTAEQRTKEMGIRKVLGAGQAEVMRLFAGMFLKIFVLACVLAVPAAWYIAHEWLQGFAYRTPISPMVFGLSLLGLLLITLLTISYELWRSARANPVQSLRTE